MRIEFATIGDGTSVEVRLLEDLGGTEVVSDRIYTADHQVRIHFGVNFGVPLSARGLFRLLEKGCRPPVIGGKFAAYHPYWAERRKKNA